MGCSSGGQQASPVLEGTFYVEAGSRMQPKVPGQSHRPSRSSAEPPVQTWSLSQEVDRLMQAHKTGSAHLSAAQRAVSPREDGDTGLMA